MLQDTKKVKCLVSATTYYTGEGIVRARDKNLKMICVEFRNKGCVWYPESRVSKFKAWYK